MSLLAPCRIPFYYGLEHIRPLFNISRLVLAAGREGNIKGIKIVIEDSDYG